MVKFFYVTIDKGKKILKLIKEYDLFFAVFHFFILNLQNNH